MELILLLICFLMISGTTVVDGNGPVIINTKEDKDVILPCSFNKTLTDKRIQWIKDNKEIFIVDNGQANPSSQDQQLRNRVSHFPDELGSGNASIQIKEAKLSDDGNYDCKYFEPGKKTPLGLIQIKLNVEPILKDRIREMPLAEQFLRGFAKPSVSIVGPTDDGMLLSCEVLYASSEPTVVWCDSAGHDVSNKPPKVIKKGDHYDVILETTVTKTDNYTCVATQKDRDHKSKKQTYVPARGNGISVTRSLVLIGITIGVLTGV